MSVPKVFISYSHDTQEHKKWVLELATRLRNSGIDAILDQFELRPGDDVPHFMETNLAAADKILMICTEKYVEKANGGHGGVGYEKMIITSNLMKQIDGNKIIPIIRQNLSAEVPTFLKTKLYINFSKPDDYEYSYDDLVRTIHESPLFEKPPIGNNPFKEINKKELNGDTKLLDDTLTQIIMEYEIFNHPATTRVASRLNISRAFLDTIINKLVELGYVTWFQRYTQVELTDKGKMYAVEKGMIK